jgi:hypothetical protein
MQPKLVVLNTLWDNPACHLPDTKLHQDGAQGMVSVCVAGCVRDASVCSVCVTQACVTYA